MMIKRITCVFLLFVFPLWTSQGLSAPPKISPATGLLNQFYDWKAETKIRYQVSGPPEGKPVLLVHGLFVNSDHWRKTLKELGERGYRTYAVDLLGSGYSDKPPSYSPHLCGEYARFKDAPSVIKNVELGTARGETRIANVDLRHPVSSCYNFFTWSDLLTDFTKQVIQPKEKVTLVCNSIGTISTLQCLIDDDDEELYDGAFVVSPNFRELHSAEVPLAGVVMPILRTVQSLLRQYGKTVFDALAKPDTVKQILKEPYARTEAVDDTLVQVLLDPLLTEGSSRVVFDTLSYSAGPLPEQQLQQVQKPVWICYGKDDPWTPGPRVEALSRMPTVERVEGFDGVGHCPHDEAPELVHPLLLQFLQRIATQTPTSASDAVPSTQ
ncbi:hypothetical protein FisN_18Lh180 [Fistulifera solaris]|uniref:AB hydrolase-1 domain-containing protein n=1 Tax=Fistulifera solaris TaxID=1519565 RepID=A0A1Z5JUL1_FISSO|nr:hypothetical protein FisN_18Lh180 [Fistulifera solaris]|eukprot:GAX17532.1 hypothetical protein FisN_18Lh180 [Fistulifera solaris]